MKFWPACNACNPLESRDRFRLFPKNYLLVDYLRRHSLEPVRFVVGVSTLAQFFGQEHYENLPGSVLEGMGKLLAKNVRILAFPMPKPDFLAALGTMTNNLEPLPPDLNLVTASALRPKPPMSFLYDFIRATLARSAELNNV